MLDNTRNQPSKFRTKNWVEINDDARRMYDKDSQIKFRTSILKSSLGDYSDGYILVKGKISIARALVPAEQNNVDKEVVYENCALFTDCISEINNTQIDNVKEIDVVMSMYNNVTEYRDNCSKASGTLWQYYRDELALTDAGAVANFHAVNNSASFKSK